MLSLYELQKFHMDHNLIPGTEITLTLDEYTKVVDDGKNLHGELFAQILRDSFMPEGEAIEPGYEDSLSHYTYLPDTWSEVRLDFEKLLEGY